MQDKFCFQRADLQQKLTALVVAMGLEYRIEGGCLCTAADDDLVVEDLRSAVRTSVFRDWHLWRGGAVKTAQMYERYLAYMKEHDIAFVEEVDNDTRWFLLDVDSDPKDWGIEEFEE